MLFSLSGGGIPLGIIRPRTFNTIEGFFVLAGFCFVFGSGPSFGDGPLLSVSSVVLFSVLLFVCYAPVLMYTITQFVAAISLTFVAQVTTFLFPHVVRSVKNKYE